MRWEIAGWVAPSALAAAVSEPRRRVVSKAINALRLGSASSVSAIRQLYGRHKMGAPTWRLADA